MIQIKINPIIIIIIILTALFLIHIIGTNYFPENYYLDNRPECYIAKDDKCMDNYNYQKIYGNAEDSGFIQCCMKPHYVLQGIDIELMNFYMGGNWATQKIFENYNCSFDIDRKSHCTTTSDCLAKPDLDGCSKLDCNVCCNNMCTVMYCGK